ncbi:MAG: hypothetical protein V9G18_09790 [Albidovulum sp.]|jgi:hypothetical protein
MKERPEFPELLPPDAPHAVPALCPGWWILPAAVLGVLAFGGLILTLI